MTKLPANFEEFSENKKQSFIDIKNLKDSGHSIVGIFCAYTPVEVMDAVGAISVSLCGTDEAPIPSAEAHLPRNLCPLVKSSYGHALDDSCPYFYFSDLIIGETTCDGKKKMYELLGKIKTTHVMQLPNDYESPVSLKLWKSELDSLVDFIEVKLDVSITDDDLRRAIYARNKFRDSLKSFHELGRLIPPPISGYEMLQVLNGAGFSPDKLAQARNIERFKEHILDEYDMGLSSIPADRKRILITGSPIGGATEKIISTIEEFGGTVVCFETCGGIKSVYENVREDIHPVDALAEKYLGIPCSCMHNNKKRFELLDELVDDYSVDGVIEVVLQSCHTYNIESYSVKRFVESEKEVPYLHLETDYSSVDSGQLQTRISAFLEML